MVWTIAFGVVLGLLINRLAVKPLASLRKDDTDPPRRFSQSGLMIYVDHRTGLQYLGSGLGGLTPRLDENGRHIKSEDA